MAGLMISFGPDKGGKGGKPMPTAEPGEDSEEGGDPFGDAFEAFCDAVKTRDAEMGRKAFELMQRCCGEDEAPTSERG